MAPTPSGPNPLPTGSNLAAEVDSRASFVTFTSDECRLVAVTAHPGPARSFMVTDAAGHHHHEIRDRAYAAIKNSGLSLPTGGARIRMSSTAAGLTGTAADLAVAAAALGAAGYLPDGSMLRVALIGELGLDGTVRPVRNVAAMVAAAVAHNRRTVIVAAENALDAATVPGAHIFTVGSLSELVSWARITTLPGLQEPEFEHNLTHRVGEVPADVAHALFAVEVAAAGGHHLYLAGSDDTPVRLLASMLAAILPDLEEDAGRESADLHAAAGIAVPESSIIRIPPMQAPHHSATMTDIFGSRRQPGAISLAHHGVLLLADAAAFVPVIHRSLRQVLDSGIVRLGGPHGSISYPARTQLAAISRPCTCTCDDEVHRRQQTERLHLLQPVVDVRATVSSTALAGVVLRLVHAATRVAAARRKATERWVRHGWRTNAQVELYRTHLAPPGLDPSATASLDALRQDRTISNSAYARSLSLAWTVSDLHGADMPNAEDVTAATALYLGAEAPSELVHSRSEEKP
ncbi:ATP-binding protein [Actinoplanes sp. NPDC051859]|uniref:ATP-binding protein n=1 Tax=Actinoplanes sp. NPDC051859 TaxID=3363909 RepID=UPI0037A690F6